MRARSPNLRLSPNLSHDQHERRRRRRRLLRLQLRLRLRRLRHHLSLPLSLPPSPRLIIQCTISLTERQPEREREWLFISLASLLNKLGSSLSLPGCPSVRPSMHQPSAVLLEWERRRRRRRILSRSLSGQMSSPDHRRRSHCPTAQPRDCAGCTERGIIQDHRLRDSRSG